MPTRTHDQNTLLHGSWNAICDVCGFKYKARDLKKRWDGLMVCKEDWEPRHPSDSFRVPPESTGVAWTRVDSNADTTAVQSAGEDHFLYNPPVGQPLNTNNEIISGNRLYTWAGVDILPEYIDDADLNETHDSQLDRIYIYNTFLSEDRYFTLQGLVANDAVNVYNIAPQTINFNLWEPATPYQTMTGGQLNPDGRQSNAYKLTEDGAGGPTAPHYQASWASNKINNEWAGTELYYSCYAKAAENNYVILDFSDKGWATRNRVSYDLSTGVATTLLGAPRITGKGTIDLGNGWYRCWFSFIPTQGTTGPDAGIHIYLSKDGTNLNYQGVLDEGIYIYGPSLNTFGETYPYIPNMTSAMDYHTLDGTDEGSMLSIYKTNSSGPGNLIVAAGDYVKVIPASEKARIIVQVVNGRYNLHSYTPLNL